MTTDQAPQQPRLRIRLLGTFAVERDGVALPVAEVGSRKARTVLKILAAHRGRTVSMDSLVASLWGDASPADAAANVATLVSRLRATLGAGVIGGSRAGYRLLTGSSVVVDLEEAAGLVAEADARLGSGQPALATVAADAASAVLGPGTVLEDEPDADVAGEAGREAERLSRRARSACWRAAAAVGDHRRALAVATDATTADPLDEEAHRAIMLAYHRLGEPGEALAAYERLRTVLVEELGVDPGPETERVYRAVLLGEPVEAEAPSKQQGATAGKASLVGRADELEQHRLPSRSKATPFAPGTPVAKAVAVGGVASLGVKLQTLALALSATKRSPVSFNAMPRGLQGVGSLPTNTKVGLERLMRQTGQNVSPRLGIGIPAVYRFPA